MYKNNSPWIKQLNRIRPVDKANANLSKDIAIVGGGIAGVCTAYFVLKNTDFNVVLIEGGKVAHGATGHNAGQMTSYFERQISNISKEFGSELAREGQSLIDSAWILLEEIYKESNLTTPFYQFTGYAGIADFNEVIVHLENNLLLKDVSNLGEPLMISDDVDFKSKIDKKYDGLYSLVPKSDIHSLLETKDQRYIAAISARKGVMNSAMFTEELAGYLISKFKDRFVLWEESFVSHVILEKEKVILRIGEYNVETKKTVLCTNGFEKFKIINNDGKDIDTNFHHLINGAIGYMAAYLDDLDKPPTAISYLQSSSTGGNFDSDPYFYMTRRPFEAEENKKHNLISVGGPDVSIEDTSTYSREEHIYSEDAFKEIDNFVKTTISDNKVEMPYAFHWHGLMGYTPNGVRLIGEELINPKLLYNLGCNGVGILPSIYGAKRISDILKGEKQKPSIFDPKSVS